ncbi:MAG: exodeoxyribonuclease V subunit alpha [Candidatus Electrothrix sp. YB6]
MLRDYLQHACEKGEIRLLDFHLGLFLEKCAIRQGIGADQDGNPALLLAATLAGAAIGNGHVCQPLDQPEEWPFSPEEELIPDPEQWRRSLLAGPVVGQPGEVCPLILDEQNRLYLYRYYCYEEFLAAELRRRATGDLEMDLSNRQTAGELLHRLFSGNKQSGAVNFQQLAATLALLKPLVIISGGPGTGKTYTVARILALLLALQKQQEKPGLRIALAAPTGKAAARLEESIRRAKEGMQEELAEDIPEQAHTLHRLLGARPGADAFRYNRTNPLYLDLLILDESSMIDVGLMVALLQALPRKTRIILLGDRHQLVSVEAGSLFADLCANNEPVWSARLCAQLEGLTGITGLQNVLQNASSADPLADSLVVLRNSYRFQGNSGIGSLAAAVNSGDMEKVDKVITSDYADLEVMQHTGEERETWLRQQIIPGFRRILEAASPEDALCALEEFRFLCALRNGPAGVEGINTMVTQILRQNRLISGSSGRTELYPGKPVMILRNHYELQLFNGDTGILWKDGQGRLRAWFRQPEKGLASVSLSRLPEHETAYAITIHKAQGSEFDQVLLLLPEEDSRILTRELLYTGITRARTRLILCTDRDILATAVGRRTKRHSGLEEKLRGKMR